MIGTAAALLGSAAIGAGASLYSSNKAAKAQKQAGAMGADAARQAAAQQQASIDRGISESQPYYQQGQNYLSPYVQAGQQSSDIMNDIIGLNGPEKQQAALGMYKSSPRANLLQQARDEAVRRATGEYAARGMSRSGALTQDLAERTSAMDLDQYGQWENLNSGLFNTGANAASAAGNMAVNRGNTVLDARTGQGTAGALGTMGAANYTIGGNIGASNANMAGMNGVNNWLQFAAGGAGQNDWLKNFGSTTTPGTAANGGWSTTTTKAPSFNWFG